MERRLLPRSQTTGDNIPATITVRSHMRGRLVQRNLRRGGA